MRVRRPNSQPKIIVGLMSGTSADGIDAVVARFSRVDRKIQAKVLAHVHCPFAAGFRRHVLKCALVGSVAEICELNFTLGERFAAAALQAIQKAGLKSARVAAIGSHGQTVHHLPNARTPSTLQIGESAIIAERTGITTISDFRVRDMACGGQGAPLVPFADWILFSDPRRPRIVQNIGGIGNLTFVPPGAVLSEVMAFDTGPGNMVIDAVVSSVTNGRLGFDEDGRLGSKGKVSSHLLSELKQHPYLHRSPPKTTGREEFGTDFVSRTLRSAGALRLSPNDIVATVTALTAETIVEAYRRFVFPRLSDRERDKLEIILGGGGAQNPCLVQMLGNLLPFGRLTTHEEFGIANEAKEALAFALLAHETLLGRPGNVPSATGAQRAVVLGKITPA